MSDRVIRPLTLDTWDAFEALAAKHNGVFGGCWCSWFHADEGKEGISRQEFTRRRVADGVAHAALVFDGDTAIAWAEYGSPVELPRINHQREREASPIAASAYRPSFLATGTRGTFEAEGFVYEHPLGTKRCLMPRAVEPAA